MAPDISNIEPILNLYQQKLQIYMNVEIKINQCDILPEYLKHNIQKRSDGLPTLQICLEV